MKVEVLCVLSVIRWSSSAAHKSSTSSHCCDVFLTRRVLDGSLLPSLFYSICTFVSLASCFTWFFCSAHTLPERKCSSSHCSRPVLALFSDFSFFLPTSAPCEAALHRVPQPPSASRLLPIWFICRQVDKTNKLNPDRVQPGCSVRRACVVFGHQLAELILKKSFIRPFETNPSCEFNMKNCFSGPFSTCISGIPLS